MDIQQRLTAVPVPAHRLHRAGKFPLRPCSTRSAEPRIHRTDKLGENLVGAESAACAIQPVSPANSMVNIPKKISGASLSPYQIVGLSRHSLLLCPELCYSLYKVNGFSPAVEKRMRRDAISMKKSLVFRRGRDRLR